MNPPKSFLLTGIEITVFDSSGVLFGITLVFTQFSPYISKKQIIQHILQCNLLLIATNARLRGWQRITTKLKHNNRNQRGSMGLETPRVDSPS